MRGKARAKRKGHEWNIDEYDYQLMIQTCCRYCGGKLEASGVGLDRKDNTLGYVTSNVVPCCRTCNILKHDYFTYEEMMILSPHLVQIRIHRIL